MFKEAAKYYDYVIVGLNSDAWLTRKKGKEFMSFNTRKAVLESIKYIDLVIGFDDSNDHAISLLQSCKQVYPDAKITFGNGGDRGNRNYPEYNYCIGNGIFVEDSLGGVTKANSSSAMLDAWSKKQQKVKRSWGYWQVLKEYKHNLEKVKELVVYPKQQLSWQQHDFRSELWFVREGAATIYCSDDPKLNIEKHIIPMYGSFIIPVKKWHTVTNDTTENISIVEIQYGSACVESDIHRDVFPGVS